MAVAVRASRAFDSRRSIRIPGLSSSTTPRYIPAAPIRSHATSTVVPTAANQCVSNEPFVVATTPGNASHVHTARPIIATLIATPPTWHHPEACGPHGPCRPHPVAGAASGSAPVHRARHARRSQQTGMHTILPACNTLNTQFGSIALSAPGRVIDPAASTSLATEPPHPTPPIAPERRFPRAAPSTPKPKRSTHHVKRIDVVEGTTLACLDLAQPSDRFAWQRPRRHVRGGDQGPPSTVPRAPPPPRGRSGV